MNHGRHADARGVKVRLLAPAILLALLLAAPTALAVPEQGDAGETPATAQDLTTQVVDSITGQLAGQDTDLYRICLSGGRTFSATTVGLTTTNTQLFLFDGSGRGVYANDDSADTEQSTLPAGDPLTPNAPGEYFLAVSPSDRDPLSAAGPIFNNVPYLVGADGRGAASPLALWEGRPRTAGAYEVALTGTKACESVAPTIDLRSPRDGAVVAQGAAVRVDFSCADEGGSGLVYCGGTVPDGGLLPTSSVGQQSVTVTARDGAGNETTATSTVEVVDETDPVIEISSPADGAVYSPGEAVSVDYECRDQTGGSGLASCTGDLPDGAALDTSAPGQYIFTVSATDIGGNSATRTVAYEVAEPPYDFGGFQWPVDPFPAVNSWPAGFPVPIRFSLNGDQGPDVLADGYPQVAEVRCRAGETPDSGTPARSAWRKGLRYRSRKDRYVYWWKTKREWAGSCRQFLLKLDDGSLHRAEFRFTRSHPWSMWLH
jgi:Bacterial pre-peptidase C-terminal domain